MLKMVEIEAELAIQRDHSRRLLLITWLSLHDAVEVSKKSARENLRDHERIRRCEAVLCDVEKWIKKMRADDAGN